MRQTDRHCQSAVCDYTVVCMIRSQPVERFIKSVEAENRNAEGFSSAPTEELQQFNIKDRSVIQSYDGAVVMGRGHGRVQVLMKEILLIQSMCIVYAHQLNLVTKKIWPSMRRVLLSLAIISGISPSAITSPNVVIFYRRSTINWFWHRVRLHGIISPWF